MVGVAAGTSAPGVGSWSHGQRALPVAGGPSCIVAAMVSRRAGRIFHIWGRTPAVARDTDSRGQYGYQLITGPTPARCD